MRPKRQPSPEESIALERVEKKVGGRRQLAERLGIEVSAVQQWHGNGIPADRVLELEAATEGEVTRHDLRPDLFGPPSEQRASA